MNFFGMIPGLSDMWGKASAAVSEAAHSPIVQEQVAKRQAAVADAGLLADRLATTSFATQDDVDHALMGKSEQQIADLRAQYDAKNGPGAWEDRFGATDNRRWQRMATVDQEKAKSAASAIFDAMDGVGTDEDGVGNALRGKSADEIAEIKRLYAEMYPGRSMDDDVASEVGGDSAIEINAILTGDVVTAAVQGLENAAWGVGTDEKKIEEILRGVPADKRAEVALRYQTQFGVDLSAMLQDEFSFSDSDAMVALAAGDVNKADAIQLDAAMNGGFLGIGTDVARAHEIMEGSSDPTGLADAYKGVQDEKWLGGDASLEAGLADEMSGAELDVATLILSSKNADPKLAAKAQVELAAARIQLAGADGAGTDEDGLWKQLAGKKPEEQQAIMDAWTEKYGGEGAGKEAFFTMLSGELGHVDPALAAQVKDGTLDVTVALRVASLQYAIGGDGTDEQLLKDTLKGLKKEEIQALRDSFTAAGRDLDHELFGDKESDDPQKQAGELTGRDAFDVQQMLKGEPQTLEEKVERMKERYAWERGEGSSFVDTFSNSGAALDSKYEQVSALMEKANADGNLDEAERFALERQLSYIDGTQGSYAAAKDRVADTAASVATSVGALAITLGTGGLGAGAMAAALYGAAGGGAMGMLTKGLIKGNAYGDEEMGLDIARTLVSMATAGVGQAASVGSFAADQAAGLGLGTLGTTLAKEAIKGGIGGFVGGAAGGLLNEQLWEQGDIGGYALGVLGQTLGGAAQNLGSGGLKAGLDGRLDGLGIVARNTLLGAAGGVGGGVMQTAFDPNSYMRGIDGFLSAAAMSSALGAVNGAAGGAVQGFAEQAAFSKQFPGLALPEAAAPLALDPEMPIDQLLGLPAASDATPAAPKAYDGIDLSSLGGSAPTTDDIGVLLGISMAPEGASLTAEDGMVTQHAANPRARQEIAQANLAQMDPDAAAFIRGMVDYAQNDAQRAILERAVAAGRSPGEIMALGQELVGKSEGAILTDYSGAGMWQKAQQSCVPTSYQIASAQLDPVIAANLRADPAAAAQAQFDALAEHGGAPTPRQEMSKGMIAELKANPELQDTLQQGLVLDKRSLGIDPSLMTDGDLHAQLEAASGTSYEFQGKDGVGYRNSDGTFAEGAVPHDAIQGAIDDGRPVLFAAKGHYRVIVGSGTAHDGSPGYIVTDPMTGAYEVVPRAWIDGGHPMYAASSVLLPGDGPGAAPAVVAGDDAALAGGGYDAAEVPAVDAADYEDDVTLDEMRPAELDDDVTPVDQKMPEPEEIEAAAVASGDDEAATMGADIAAVMASLPEPVSEPQKLGWRAKIGAFFGTMTSRVADFFKGLFGPKPVTLESGFDTLKHEGAFEDKVAEMADLREGLMNGDLEADKKLLDGVREDLRPMLKDRIDQMRPHLGKLSPDELVAIFGYTTNDYAKLNDAMRGKLSPQETAALQPYIDRLKSGLAKLPDYEGTIFRGTQMSEGRFEKMQSDYASNKLTFDDAVSSTTSSEGVSERSEYMDLDGSEAKEGRVKVKEVIVSKTGKDIWPLSDKADEQEVLFQAGTKFKITNIEKQDDYWIVYKSEI